MSETGAHSTQPPSESFLREVRAVQAAEAKAAAQVAAAQSQAAAIVSNAQAKAVEVASGAADKAVAEKNRIIAQERRRTDDQLKKMLAAALERAQTLSARRLSPAGASEIAESL